LNAAAPTSIAARVYSPATAGGMLSFMSDVTIILSAIEAGDPQAADQLLPLVYDELRKLAAAKLAYEKAGQTLQATALVHEAYLRLVGGGERESTDGGRESVKWESRGHFFAAAAEAMRRILVDQARRKKAAKRGSAAVRCDLHGIELAAAEVPEDLVALDEALTALAAIDKPAADLVHLRYFAGLSIPDAAEVLHISPRTAARIWAYARAWLRRKIEGQDPSA